MHLIEAFLIAMILHHAAISAHAFGFFHRKSRQIDRDTIVRCFNTYAFRPNGGEKWAANIRCVAIYDDDGEDTREQSWLERKMEKWISKHPNLQKRLGRWSNTTALFRHDPVEGKDIYIRFVNAAANSQFVIGRTNKLGEAEKTVPLFPDSIPADDKHHLKMAQFQLIRSEAADADPISNTSVVLINPDAPFGVFTDIDDTIKVTQVLSLPKMFKNAFERDYNEVPGMPKLFERMKNRFGAVNTTSTPPPPPMFFYVSGTPWQLVDTLDEFLNRLYPPGEMVLQQFRFSINSLLGLKNVRKYKNKRFDVAHERFPNLRWYLVGDSGQLDPEIYADIYHRYPDKIICIWIVKVQGTKPKKEKKQNSDQRFEKTFNGIPLEKWKAFNHPDEIMSLSEGKCR